MSDQPKVSERMERLVIAYALTVAYPTEPQKVNAARCALLSAIAEIEQRAEKWKAAAVAYQKWRDAYFKWEPDELVEHPQVHLDLEAAQDRLEAATAALGDEWDKAVEEKHHG